MSNFSRAAAEVSSELEGKSKRISRFAAVAAEVKETIGRTAAAADKDAEWQRVHSYIADVLKDSHVLYAKLARLEGDFTGPERDELERISEKVLDIGENLSAFAKEFYQGKFSMVEKGFSYGQPEGMAPRRPGGPEEAPPEEDLGLEGEEAPPEEEPEIPVVIEGEEEEEEELM